jgi:uncharacterized protein YecE (DUF72 family)
MLRLGTSGWQYDHWRGVLYPPDLPRREWLAHYASVFDCVEVDATFYGLPQPESVAAWRRAVPKGFLFAPKLSRYATHMKRLKDPEATLGRFLGALRPLGPALGPILAQLPPRWRADPARLAAFLAAAPRDLRLAVEVRDPSWLCEPVYAVLRARGAALCLHDLIPEHPRVVTADFVYLRFHGDPLRIGYTAARLAAEARRVRAWLRQGLDVFAFFNNDAGGHAVRDAIALLGSLTRAGAIRSALLTKRLRGSSPPGSTGRR